MPSRSRFSREFLLGGAAGLGDAFSQYPYGPNPILAFLQHGLQAQKQEEERRREEERKQQEERQKEELRRFQREMTIATSFDDPQVLAALLGQDSPFVESALARRRREEEEKQKKAAEEAAYIESIAERMGAEAPPSGTSRADAARLYGDFYRQGEMRETDQLQFGLKQKAGQLKAGSEEGKRKKILAQLEQVLPSDQFAAAQFLSLSKLDALLAKLAAPQKEVAAKKGGSANEVKVATEFIYRNNGGTFDVLEQPQNADLYQWAAQQAAQLVARPELLVERGKSGLVHQGGSGGSEIDDVKAGIVALRGSGESPENIRKQALELGYPPELVDRVLAELGIVVAPSARLLPLR